MLKRVYFALNAQALWCRCISKQLLIVLPNNICVAKISFLNWSGLAYGSLRKYFTMAPSQEAYHQNCSSKNQPDHFNRFSWSSRFFSVSVVSCSSPATISSNFSDDWFSLMCLHLVHYSCLCLSILWRHRRKCFETERVGSLQLYRKVTDFSS